MQNRAYDWFDAALNTIHRADWYRSVVEVEGCGSTVKLEGKNVINFASNNYLGLAGDDRLIQAAIAATQRYGTGSTGSRLLSGHRSLHQELEQALASWKKTEDALVFSSGYLANIGTIAAIVGKRDLILGDRFNHSSLKNGAILSGAAVLDYAHNDIKVLETLLKEHRQNYRRCLIITDSIFSMDGDLCPLPALLDIAEQFNAMVLVDEAHATGVLGETGAGSVEYFGCRGRSLIQVGTLSKALGSLGGYVAGDRNLIDFLRNRSPTFVYTTGLSPADTAAALEAIKIIQQEPQRRANLWQNIHTLKQLLTQKLSLPLLPSDSAILCIELESATQALSIAKKLRTSGIFAPAIRPPTVPTSRLRLSLMATHEPEQIDYLVTVLQEVL